MSANETIIAVTGWGSVSSLGSFKKDIWNNYLNTDSLLKNKTFNNIEYPVAALHPQAEEEISSLKKSDKKYSRLDRTALMAMLAAHKAFDSAELKNSDYHRIGVNIGSSRGATGLWEDFYKDYLLSKDKQTALLTSPLTTLGNVSSEVASYLQVSGPVISNSTTCSTAFQAIGNAMAWLKSDMADAFIAGGSEAPLTEFTLAQTEALGIYTKNILNQYPSRPFSAELKPKNTFALGEGAAVFVLEKMNSIKKRKIKPLVIIESIGFAFETPPSATGLNTEGTLLIKSMKDATDKMISSEPIDMVLLHGTGTVKGDIAEMNAVKSFFNKNIPILYTNKWKIGHTYAASAALHLELAILCILNNTSLDLPYSNLLTNRKTNIRKVMINATGFGGNASSLIISNYF